MKNKKSIYILLPIVLLIWGFVAYRFFALTGEAEIQADNVVAPTFKTAKVQSHKKIAIDVKYRDPFLGKVYTGITAEKKPAGKGSKIVTPAPATEWPSIIYKGLVSDTGDKKKVFMVVINNSTYIMSEKQTEGEVTLIKGNRSEINVVYKNHKNKILLQP